MIRAVRLRSVLDDDAIYIGDAGHVFCGRHAGHSARYTGHDISGQEVWRVPKELLAEVACELCDPIGGAA